MLEADEGTPMQKKAAFIFALSLGIPLLVPEPCFPEQARHKSLTIFFGDNVNGSIESCPVAKEEVNSGFGQKGSWVQSVRETRKDSLLLDSGDLFFDRYEKRFLRRTSRPNLKRPT